MSTFLNHNEINESSIIMVEKEDGSKKPYFIAFKAIGALSQGTMLLGHHLDDIIKNPALFPCKKGYTDRLYVSSDVQPNGGNKVVKGYRRLSETEKEEWLDNLNEAGIHELAKIL